MINFGLEFSTLADKFNRLDEVLQIHLIHPANNQERSTRLLGQLLPQPMRCWPIPPFRDHIPLMVGGSSEKKTIPLAARHFNVIAGFDALQGKARCK